MNITCNHIVLYIIFIIATGIDFALPWPIFNLKPDSNVQHPFHVSPKMRFSRQVVQPSWLNFGQEAVADPTVHVNLRALSEAEEIRKNIQKAVKEGTYVVADNQQDPISPSIIKSLSENKNGTASMYGFPSWYIQLQKLSHNWMQKLFKGIHN